MKKLILAMMLCGVGSIAYGEAPNKQMIEQKLQQLTEVDEKIEGLVKKRIQLKVEASEEVEHGADSILPREARREDRSAEGLEQQIQSITQELEQLEAERQAILTALQ